MKTMLLFCLLITTQLMAVSNEDYTAIYDSYTLEAQFKYPQAIAKMTEIYAKNSDDYFVNYRLGWLFSLDLKYKNSVDHYKRAAIKNSTALEPWLALSSMMINLGEWQSAINFSEEILKRNPGNYYGNLRFIMGHLRLKNYAIALEKVEYILKSYPLDPIFLEQKAFALAESGKTELAKKAVRDLILVSPSNIYAKTFMNKAK